MGSRKIVEVESNISHIIRSSVGYPGMSGLFMKSYERYGFGFLEVGESVAIDLADHAITKSSLHAHVHNYGYRKGIKFKTKTVDGVMHIMRIQ